ncbi:hypothetical protein SAMN06297422_10792 [Lachnospiraceae bacterium]|nr:hypothetical protein SAMN06297422_10792 [Lachnospiraceae bacterium]
MAYQLNKTEETAPGNRDAWTSPDWRNYQTTSGDGGFLDSFNELKRQMDFVAGQYRNQLENMKERKARLDKEVKDSIVTTGIIALIPAAYNLILLLLSSLGSLSGLFSIFYIFMNILNFAVFLVCEFFMLPGAIRTMSNRLWQKKILNSGPEKMTYRQKNHIISFDDERRFLEDRIDRYNVMCKEIEEKELDKGSGMFNILYVGETNELLPEQKDILDKMRKLTVQQDYQVTVAETRRDAGPEWLIIGFSIFIGLLCFLAVLATR